MRIDHSSSETLRLLLVKLNLIVLPSCLVGIVACWLKISMGIIETDLNAKPLPDADPRLSVLDDALYLMRTYFRQPNDSHTSANAM